MSTDLTFNQALEFHKHSKLIEAKELYEKFLQNNSEHSDTLHLLGTVSYSLGDYDKACILVKKALSIEPHEFYYNTLGNIYKAQKRVDEALRMYEKALSKNTHYAEAAYNLANLLQEENRVDEAMEMYAKSLLINSNNTSAFYNLGILLHAQCRYNEAIAMYQKALLLEPNNADIYVNLGMSLNALNRLDEALQIYEKALFFNNEHVKAQWNKSFTLLLKGELIEGFRLYEWKKSTAQQRTFSKPVWTDELPLDGKTILVHTDQGYGDTIQFCRYIELLSKLNCKIIFEVEKPLFSFLTQIPDVAQFIEKGEPLPEFDFHIPIMTLPLAFKTDINSIPAKKFYLKANTKKVQVWKERLGFTCKPRIGLAWSGNPSHNNDHNRSVELALLLQYLPKEFEYICLQKEIRQRDQESLKNSQIISFTDDIVDFSDTAALCENMDLIVSVDTSVAHLSASLGKKTYLLLPYSPDWRWMLHRNETPWYPSMKLFRQMEIGKWDAPFTKLANSITGVF